jgi:hypothetical protein
VGDRDAVVAVGRREGILAATLPDSVRHAGGLGPPACASGVDAAVPLKMHVLHISRTYHIQHLLGRDVLTDDAVGPVAEVRQLVLPRHVGRPDGDEARETLGEELSDDGGPKEACAVVVQVLVDDENICVLQCLKAEIVDLLGGRSVRFDGLRLHRR